MSAEPLRVLLVEDDEDDFVLTTSLLSEIGNQKVNVEWAPTYLDAPSAPVMLDVDHFKSVNDSYGHPFGDEVLRWLSQLVRGTARTADITARHGGEEWAVILPEMNSLQALGMAERLRRRAAPARSSRAGATDSTPECTPPSASGWRCRKGTDVNGPAAPPGQMSAARRRSGRNEYLTYLLVRDFGLVNVRQTDKSAPRRGR